MKTTLTNGITSASYVYNALGQRVEKKVGSVYTEYVYGAYGEVVATHDRSTWTRHYAPPLFGPLGVYEDGLTRFIHKNHLGSSTFLTDNLGAVTQKTTYYPFGQSWVSAGTIKDNRFASLDQRDAETTTWQDPLDPTMFRLYTSGLGRWLSPDPLGGSVTNPQSLNRYAYVLNNPTNLIDPLGLGDCKWDESNQNLTCPGPKSKDKPSRVDASPNDAISGLIRGDSSFCTMTSGLFSWVMGCSWSPGLWGGTRIPPAKPVSKQASKPTGDAAAEQAATNYCQESGHGQIAFNIPFTDIPLTMSGSFTIGPVNYSTTNDITPVGPALPIPPFLSFGGGVDWTINAPESPAPTLSVGAGKNASVGSFLTPKGWQGLTVSVGPSIGPPVNFTLPPENGCGLRERHRSGG